MIAPTRIPSKYTTSVSGKVTSRHLQVDAQAATREAHKSRQPNDLRYPS